MILKSLSRRSGTKQLLTYIFKNKGEKAPPEEKPLVIKHNVRSRSLEKWVQEFEENEIFRLRNRKDNVRTYHTILSFSDKDRKRVTEKVILDIAHKYIELRGAGNMYIGTAHYNKGHVHLHIAMSALGYLTGRSNRMSKYELSVLKRDLDAYQKEKYPELVNSLPKHGIGLNKSFSEKEYQLEKRNGVSSQKQQLFEDLERAYVKSKSVEHFLSQIKAQGHEPYYRSGRLTGVKFEGERKYRFSRLGYDENKMTELDRPRSEEKQTLKELEELRSRTSQYRSKDSEKEERDEESRDDEEDEKEEKEIEEENEESFRKDYDDESVRQR